MLNLEKFALSRDLSRVFLAAEVDMQIIPRANWSDFTIKDGMKIEIVEFVGGG